MKVQSNHFGQPSKKRFIVFSCAAALASFALFARPVFAEENTDANTLPADNTISVSTESIQTTADLVETREVESSQESVLAPSSEQAQITTAETSSPSQASQIGSEGSTQPEARAFRSATTTAETEPTTATADTVTGGHYYSDDQGNWYYKDANGKKVTGEQTIDGQQVYFRDNGQQVKGAFLNTKGQLDRYYDVDTGQLWINRYAQVDGSWYYLDKDGRPVTGEQTIDGQKVYFESDGKQVKGGLQEINLFKYHYYDKDSGAMVTNDYAIAFNRNTLRYERFYFNDKGIQLRGEHTLDGQQVYFDLSYGYQIFDAFGQNGRYYDQNGHYQDLGRNQFVQLKGDWYYLDKNGQALFGQQTIDGVQMYFDKDSGKQAKGIFAPNGKYYDKDSGALVTNSWISFEGNTYYVDEQGKLAKETAYIDNEEYYFDPKTGAQVKGQIYHDKYYDAVTGKQVTKQYVQITDDKGKQNWYYFDKNGYQIFGPQNIDGVQVYFNQTTGAQVKGNFAANGKYYDSHSGALTDLGKNRYVQINHDWYYLGSDGTPLRDQHTIDGVDVYFEADGKQAKDKIFNGFYYDKDSGAKKEVPRNQFITVTNGTFYFDDQGQPLQGAQTINGNDYYFLGDGSLLKGGFGSNNSGTYYDKATGLALKAPHFIEKSNGDISYLNEDGSLTTGFKTIDGKHYYFSQIFDGTNSQGTLVKNHLIRLKPIVSWFLRVDNTQTYYIGDDGTPVTNRYIQWEGDWYYFGNDGKALQFDQVVDGVQVYFDYQGKQAKGKFISDYKGTRYYDEHSGALVTNQTLTINGQTYHFDADGRGTIIN